MKLVKVKKLDYKIIIEFRSQSFLQQQSTSMVGCLKYLGENKWNLRKFESVMKSKKGFYAPHRLLQKVYFCLKLFINFFLFDIEYFLIYSPS